MALSCFFDCIQEEELTNAKTSAYHELIFVPLDVAFGARMRRLQLVEAIGGEKRTFDVSLLVERKRDVLK